MIKQLTKSVREYKKASIATPILVGGEVVMECTIPFIIAYLVNTVKAGCDMDNPDMDKPHKDIPAQRNTEQEITQEEKTNLSNYQSINLDGMDGIDMRSRYEELIRDNLELDILAQNSRLDMDRISEMVEIMLDVVCSTKPTIRINGEDNKNFLRNF